MLTASFQNTLTKTSGMIFFLNLARPWTYLFLEINMTRFKKFYFFSLENDLVQIIRRYKFSKLEKMTFEAQCFA